LLNWSKFFLGFAEGGSFMFGSSGIKEKELGDFNKIVKPLRSIIEILQRLLDK
jgi:hypothetical protein